MPRAHPRQLSCRHVDLRHRQICSMRFDGSSCSSCGLQGTHECVGNATHRSAHCKHQQAFTCISAAYGPGFLNADDLSPVSHCCLDGSSLCSLWVCNIDLCIFFPTLGLRSAFHLHI